MRARLNLGTYGPSRWQEQLAPRDSEMDFVLEGQGETDPPATQNQLGQIASSQLDKNQR